MVVDCFAALYWRECVVAPNGPPVAGRAAMARSTSHLLCTVQWSSPSKLCRPAAAACSTDLYIFRRVIDASAAFNRLNMAGERESARPSRILPGAPPPSRFVYAFLCRFIPPVSCKKTCQHRQQKSQRHPR
jgi:hypothetical protein